MDMVFGVVLFLLGGFLAWFWTSAKLTKEFKDKESARIKKEEMESYLKTWELCYIEKALNIKLFPWQEKYLRSAHVMDHNKRANGKTTAYCIALALSTGKPIDIRNLWQYADTHEHGRQYSEGWFRHTFMDIWHTLKDAGLPVREIRY
jgi:hypothetical protein